MKQLLYVLVVASLVFSSCTNAGKQGNVESPDGRIQLQFKLDEQGTPLYTMKFNDIVVLDDSKLGFELQGQEPLVNGLTVVSYASSSTNETWENVWGENKNVENNYNELRVSLLENSSSNRSFDIIFKVFNDGVGFRYVFPEQEGMTDVVITDEKTEFNLTGDHMSWWIPGDWDIYEHLYTKSLLSMVDAGEKRNNPWLGQTYIPDEHAVNTPLTMKTEEGIYISIHEANLTDYAGMTLHIDKESFVLSSALVAWEDGTKVKTQTPFVTPWRTIQVTDRAGDLIESDMLLNLNEPNRIENTDWIKPTKYVGIWWEMHLGTSSWGYEGGRHGATTENAKRYIDFAAKNNLDGVLIEGWNTGWENWVGEDRDGIFDWLTPYPDFDIDAVVAYGKEKGVEIIGHHETSGDVGNYDKNLPELMQFYNEKGIGAVKTGYVGTIIPATHYHHGQWMVNHYRKALLAAAENEVMVVAHEPIKATGIRRTYPNFMAREGLRGQEFNAWSDGNPPSHTAIVPFTRMLAGPIDFTPGIFNIKMKKLPEGMLMEEAVSKLDQFEGYKEANQINTTLAKQLALYVVLYSPVQMAADLPQHYEGHAAFQFIRDVAVDWEESHVLDGEIGEYVVIARKERDSDNWFVGGLTNESGRDYTVDMNFLDGDKTYTVTAYSDGDTAHWDTNPQEYEIKTFEGVDNSSKIDIKMADGGGFALSVIAE